MSDRKDARKRNMDMARLVLSQVTDDEKHEIAQILYYEELETIRRDKPLLDPGEYPIRDFEALNSIGTTSSTRGRRATAGSHGVSVIDLDPSPETAISGSSSDLVIDLDPSPEPTAKPSNRGINNPDHGYAAKKARSLRYHDMTISPGQWPSPTAGLRFDVAAFKRHHGWGTTLEEDFAAAVAAAAVDLYASPDADQEAMIHSRAWDKGDASHDADRNGYLLRGFPLAEQVVFMRCQNFWAGVSNGACYWTTLALLVYGDPGAWLRVKAEHLVHFENVLRNPANPRHGLYRALNEKWYRTWGGPVNGTPSQAAIDANLWQVLHLPGVYVPANMLDITADLYNVFLVMYSYDSYTHPKVVYETRTRGAYNSRHIFLLYVNGCHFQPMVPNDFLHWEFKLPRITLRSTKGLPLGTSKRDGIKHPWRSEMRSAGGQTAPLLIDRGLEIEATKAAVGVVSETAEQWGTKRRSEEVEWGEQWERSSSPPAKKPRRARMAWSSNEHGAQAFKKLAVERARADMGKQPHEPEESSESEAAIARLGYGTTSHRGPGVDASEGSRRSIRMRRPPFRYG